MESVKQSVTRVLGDEGGKAPQPTAAQEKQLLESSQQLLLRIEHLEQRRCEDAKAKCASQSKQPPRHLVTASDVMSENECNALIDADISRRARRARWHNMDACLRWQRVREYVAGLGMPDQADVLEELKGLLKSSSLTGVSYDTAAQRITRLNHLGI
jgi:hypothetical protein